MKNQLYKRILLTEKTIKHTVIEFQNGGIISAILLNKDQIRSIDIQDNTVIDIEL